MHPAMPADLIRDVVCESAWPAGAGGRLLGVLAGLVALVALGEALRRAGVRPVTTRRVVHVGVGLFVASTPLVFASPGPVYVLAVVFVIANYAAWRRGWWAGIHRARPASLGTVTFPLALLPALLIGWSGEPNHRYALQAAFLILAIADPLAAAVGERRGRPVPVGGAAKSAVGSLVFGAAAFVVCVLALLGWRQGGALDWTLANVLLASGVAAVVTAMTEALGGRGWDNFFVVLAAMIPLVVWEAHPELRGAMVLGAASALPFAALTARWRVLSPSGALAGGLLAAALIGLGGVAWAVPGFVFFVLSSALSRVGRRRKRRLAARSEKGAVRDAGQVYANGAVGWALLCGHALWPHPMLYWGFLGAFAAAAADTWATELGALSRRRPRLVTTGRRVARGTSGAVSAPGTVAAVAGAASVALSAWAVAGEAFEPVGAVVGLGLVVGGGVAGAFVDSLVGAIVQAQYRTPAGGTTERPDGPRVRGWPWMTNDRVNAVCTALGALTAAVGYAVLAG